MPDPRYHPGSIRADAASHLAQKAWLLVRAFHSLAPHLPKIPFNLQVEKNQRPSSRASFIFVIFTQTNFGVATPLIKAGYDHCVISRMIDFCVGEFNMCLTV